MLMFGSGKISEKFVIGSIIAWHKSFTNTPELPTGWVECNGQTLDDIESVYDGQVIPDLNGDARFLRGSNVSGTNQEATTQMSLYTWAGKLYFPNANGVLVSDADSVIDDPNYSRFSVAGVQTSSVKYKTYKARPVNMAVVWIVKVK